MRWDEHSPPGSSPQAKSPLSPPRPPGPGLALYRESVAEELRESLSLRGVARPSNELVDAALERWNIAEFSSRNPRDISVGQQQRVAVAALLGHEPKVWLLDEPTRGADAKARDELADRLRAHAAQGGAAIVATHDMEAAARFATRVIALKDGEVAFDLPVRRAFGTGGPLATEVARLVPGAIHAGEVSRAHP